MEPIYTSSNTTTFLSLLSNDQIHTISIATYFLYIIICYVKNDIVLTVSNVVWFVILVVLSHAILVIEYPLISNCLALLGLGLHWQTLKQYTLSSDNKAVLVTGCDRGIGHELVKALDRVGYEVFAGCLYTGMAGEQELKASCSSRVHTIQLDVSNKHQIHEAQIQIQETLGDKKLWAVVNNAGICFIGNIEIMTEEDIERVMTINFMGPLNICRAFLPLMRKSRGRLVNVASNAGLAPVPQMGVYCASKSALATLTEVLRYEMKMWGLHVSTIVPSGYRTGILAYDANAVADRWWKSANQDVKEDYGKDCFLPKFKMPNRDKVTSPDLSPIVNKIVHAISAKHPQSIYYSGLLARLLPYIYFHLPTLLRDPMLKIFGDWFVFQPSALKH